LKVPAVPGEVHVAEVGFTKKVVSTPAPNIGPAAVWAVSVVVAKFGSPRVADVVGVPVADVVTPSAQEAAAIVPLTVNWANALVPTKDKAASAANALGKFFMVISFKVKKGIF